MSQTTRKWIFVVYALNLMSFGPPLLVAPAFVAEMYGLPAAAGTLFVARMLGAVAVGNLVMSWLVRRSDFATVQRPFMINQTVAWAGTLFAGVLAMLNGMLNSMGWMFIFNPLLWVVVFGYLSLTVEMAAESEQLRPA
jgi:hypothetical protein